MPLYLALHTISKHRLRQGLAQSEVEPLAADEVLHTLAAYNAHPDESALAYDAATMDFVPIAAPAVSRTIISKREFRNRLGQSVRLAILAVRRSTDPAHAMYRDLLEDMKETLDSVNEVDLQNTDTIAGVYGLAQLAQAGLLPALDPAAILSPSTVEAE